MNWGEVEQQVLSARVLEQNLGKVALLLDLGERRRALLLYFDVKRGQLRKFAGLLGRRLHRDFDRFKRVFESVRGFFLKALREMEGLFEEHFFQGEAKLEFSNFFRGAMRDVVEGFTRGLSEPDQREFLNELEFLLEDFNASGLSIDHLFERRGKQLNG